MNLSADQQKVLFDVIEWYMKDKEAMKYVTLGGYAGTGKTTLIAVIRKDLDRAFQQLKVGFASYTGKAARVLRTTLSQQGAIYKQDTVGTIHSLIYSPILNENEEIIGWQTKKKIDRDLIIIDEASMVDGQIWQHLLTYQIPMLVVGDHGQLPPIRGNFYLMQKPQLRLEEIHRQAKLNPIIALSIQARETGDIKPGTYSDTVKKITMNEAFAQETVNEMLSNYTNETLILCGYNHTRKKLNAFIRSSLGFDDVKPVSGDRVICLRNNHKSGIFNGMLGTITSIENQDEKWYLAEIAMDNEDKPYKGLVSVDQFNQDSAMNFTDKRSETMNGDLFDFGYALTVHKAQGSQARKVILFEERFKQMTDDEWKRWLYTAVTRAEEELYIFGAARY